MARIGQVNRQLWRTGGRSGRGAVAAVTALLLTGGPALADWPQDLTMEIQDLHNCEVAFLSHVVEREVKGEQLVMAKAHCIDGRAFDAIRLSEYDLFEFKECTVSEKQSC